ncbi:MAG: metallophosphoesterase [Clostridia bacterium]|nr:metallophosphoesterase [Clostridia bacterium]
MTNTFSQLISKFLTSVFGTGFMLTDIKSGFTAEDTKTPKDFLPVLRFVACSDIHLNNDENPKSTVYFANLLNDMYNYAESCQYKNLDAVVVAGDFTGGGAEKEYEVYNKITSENIKDNTRLLTVLGNHEFIDYRDVDATVGYTVYKKFVNENVDTDIVINGYRFIGISYDDNGKSFTGKTKWLEERLNNATDENPEKPVFVYQHPAPTLTVYGSGNWGDRDIRKVLNKYPQVVDFSGHSHYAAVDPRSIWQGQFTAVGCGSLSAFMGNLNYIDGDKDAPGESAGAWLVECDAKGNISLKLYDAVNRMFFKDIDYYLTDLANASKRTHNWHQQKSRDTGPSFPAGAEISSRINDNGEISLVFPEARGYYCAENYKVTLTDSANKKAYEKTVISEYVRATDEDVEINVGLLEKGNYTARVISYSPYARKGQILKNKITIK